MSNEKNEQNDADLVWLDRMAALLDDRFKVPFTDFRFGLDALLGLVPYVGDLSGFVVSGVLMSMMVKKGGSVWLILQMMGNVLLDAVVGLVPFAGDFFDFGFKSNRRNVSLLRKYYASTPLERRSSGRTAIAIVAFLCFVALGLLFWMIFKLGAWIWAFVAGLF